MPSEGNELVAVWSGRITGINQERNPGTGAAAHAVTRRPPCRSKAVRQGMGPVIAGNGGLLMTPQDTQTSKMCIRVKWCASLRRGWGAGRSGAAWGGIYP